MKHYRATLALVGMSMFVVCWQWPGQAAAQVRVDVGGVRVQVGDQPQPADVEVLTRGPVHEAFAQPVVLDEGKSFLITHKPPAPLEEMPPDQKPEGNHILWIPGYWSWDIDRGDFIWVSGCWRAIPPGTSWVPGYWAEAKGGYEWIGGFWTAADTAEIEYLPAPPATLEEGPQGTGSPDSIWIPGCWVRQEGRYAWRPGFWEAAQANWVWEPAHYEYTPRGYVFVDGYWDYALHRRGVAYLPVYCPPSVYGRAGFRYSPDIVLDLDGLTLNLFVSPLQDQYYFGDYYGDAYSREGYYPWHQARDHHEWYDPIYVHRQWQHRGDNKWAENRRADYEHRRDDKTLRPARTYTAMQAQVARLPEKDRGQVQMARPMKDFVADKTTPFKFTPVDAKTREATANQAKDVHAYKDKRAQWEAPAAVPKPGPVVTPREPVPTPKESPKEPPKVIAPTEPPRTPDHGIVPREQPAGQDTQPQKVKIPKPPVAVREPVSDKELTPPAKPEHPKPDPNAKPKAPKSNTPDQPKDKDKGAPDKPVPAKP